MKNLIYLFVVIFGMNTYSQDYLHCDENEPLIGAYETQLIDSRGEPLRYIVQFYCDDEDLIAGSYVRYNEDGVAFRAGVLKKLKFEIDDLLLSGELLVTNDRFNASNRGNRLKFQMSFESNGTSFTSFKGRWSTIIEEFSGDWFGQASTAPRSNFLY